MRQPVLYSQFCDPHSILVINVSGKLRRLFCPFRVKCVKQVMNIPKGSWVIVEEVAMTPKDELIFIISGRPYAHAYFQIFIQF